MALERINWTYTSRRRRPIREDNAALIRRVEELTISAWPALHTLLYDGWVLRLAAGFTRRANSVWPLYESTLGLERKVEACEQVYRRAEQRVVFKMTRKCKVTLLVDTDSTSGGASHRFGWPPGKCLNPKPLKACVGNWMAPSTLSLGRTALSRVKVNCRPPSALPWVERRGAMPAARRFIDSLKFHAVPGWFQITDPKVTPPPFINYCVPQASIHSLTPFYAEHPIRLEQLAMEALWWLKIGRVI